VSSGGATVDGRIVAVHDYTEAYFAFVDEGLIGEAVTEA
jgi:hypothetical protein